MWQTRVCRVIVVCGRKWWSKSVWKYKRSNSGPPPWRYGPLGRYFDPSGSRVCWWVIYKNHKLFIEYILSLMDAIEKFMGKSHMSYDSSGIFIFCVDSTQLFDVEFSLKIILQYLTWYLIFYLYVMFYSMWTLIVTIINFIVVIKEHFVLELHIDKCKILCKNPPIICVNCF